MKPSSCGSLKVGTILTLPSQELRKTRLRKWCQWWRYFRKKGLNHCGKLHSIISYRILFNGEALRLTSQGLNIDVPTPNSYIEILTPNAVVLGGEDFGKWLGPDGGALTNRLSSLVRRNTRAYSLSAMWGYHQKTEPEGGSLLRMEPC